MFRLRDQLWLDVERTAEREPGLVLALGLGPSGVGNWQLCEQMNNPVCLSVFIPCLHQPGARSAGSFSLEPCLVHSRRASKRCLLSEEINACWTDMRLTSPWAQLQEEASVPLSRKS